MSSVLIVEDSPTQAQQLQLILESHGFATRIARDGREALALVKKESFDLVLTDIVMPRLSGFELCRKIKSDPKHKNLPVIILTTLTDPMDMVQALECGADNYITKPYKEDFLIHRINAVLHDSRAEVNHKFQMGAEIQFLGKKFNITSEKKQILSLLISTFEDIVRTNQDLKTSQEELTSANAKIEHYARVLEGQVQISEEKYGTLMRHAHDAILICDQEGRIVEVNEQCKALFHRSESELLGRKVEDLMGPGSSERVATMIDWIASGVGTDPAEQQTAEFQVLRKDGSMRHVEASAGEVAVEGGHLRIEILRDVTARKEDEEKLRESEERYRYLVEGSLQGLMIIQGDGIAFCNHAFAALFGYTEANELIGRDPASLLDEADRDTVLAHRAAQLRGEDVPALLKYRGVGRDGGVIWLQSMRQLVTWGGEPAIQCTSIDFTNQMHLEEQLLAAQRMEAVGRLAGGIAHDFNNMLAVMSSYGELTLDQLGENNAARKDVQVMLDATVRAAALTRQLLAFSRRQLLELKLLDINRIVDSMEKMLLRVIGEDLNLRTNLRPDIGSIRADESQIEQIIMNLAVNARDAMPTGGTLTIETARKHLDEHYVKSHMDVEPGNYVMLAVTDSGTGMDEETQRRIFEPFYTTKPLGKGTGLGLSTVYGIVKQMGGLVYVYSELGKGTCFKIYFPLVEALSRPEVQRAEKIAHLRGDETILLVEDDEHVREATRRILASGGYHVLVADNGPHAVQLAKEQQGRIQLLISDVVMPNMSGREVLDNVSQYGVPRVLFMSGYTDDSVVNHGILEGDYPFLHKPFSKDAMLEKVRAVLRAPAMRLAGPEDDQGP
jgi:PAS domain S-box-containing protein